MRVFHHPDRDFDSRREAEPVEDVFNVAFDRVWEKQPVVQQSDRSSIRGQSASRLRAGGV